MTFTIGSDPEVFVKRNGKGISAHGFIPGDKANPHKTSNGAVQVDGMALEFNTDPVPVGDFEAFNANVLKTIKDLSTFLKERAAKDNTVYNLCIEPVMDFDLEYIESQPEEAKELGCDPDFNAYTGEPNPMPKGDRPFRTGAGHIHIGWGADIPVDNPDHLEICCNFIKTMDATVGMFMAFIDRDPRRRELYGKAGAFRPKSYGVEYRTPSNLWIRNRERRQVIHYLTNQAISYQKSGMTCEQFTCNSQEEIRRIIDEGDWEKAGEVVDYLFRNCSPSRRKNWVFVRDGIR